MQDGLAQSNVFDITEDNLGNLWLATAGGLSKFNGVVFQTFKKQDGLLSNEVYCLTVDQDNNIWVGTEAGISKYNGGEFQNFPLDTIDQDHWVSHVISGDQGSIIYSTSSGKVLEIKSGSSEMSEWHQKITGHVSGLAKNQEAIWIATYQNGVYKYIDGELQEVNLSNRLKQAKITTIFSDNQGRIWLGTSAGLFAQEDGAFEFVHLLHPDNEQPRIYSISEAADGAIWVGTNKGAYRYHQGVCTAVNGSDGLTDNIVYKVHRDREGTLWFGSFGSGLFKSLGELFTHIGKKHGVTYDYISSITKSSSDNYWLGSYGGGVYQLLMSAYPKRSIVVNNYNQQQGLSSDFVYDVSPGEKGETWIATAYGLNRLQNNRIKKYFKNDGLPSNHIYSMLKTSDGSLYLGTSGGLSKVNRDSKEPAFKNYSYPGGKSHNKVRTLIELSSGEILLGTFGGLKVFDGNSIKDYFQADSLRFKGVSTVFENSEGDILCTLLDEGILYFKPKTNTAKQITENDGLSSNIVYSLVMDESGCIWAGTPHGLDKISFLPSGEIEKIRNFGANEGFFGIETNTNATYVESDGSIWFGTVEGAFKCRPDLDRTNALEPITQITGLRLFSQQMDWEGVAGNSRSQFPANFDLSHNQNHLTFEFFGNSLKNPEKVKYQYMLQHFDRDWQPITNNTEAVYTNLPPGNYTFKVKASNNDGVWNSTPASIEFSISPPFWRTWWFFTAVVVVLLVSGRLYYKSRVQQKLNALMQVENIKNQETINVRRRVAEDFHDQVGNQLASITVLVQLIQAKLSSGSNEVDELLGKLGQFTKTLFTGTRDFVWSIDPKSDEVKEMLIYIRDFGEELFEYTDVNFHVETNNSFDTNTQLPVGWSRHIVYIFKEALTNSLKHANCRNVYLDFNVSDHNYVFELRDDGKGLNGYKEEEYLGMGLQNMMERAHKIGGEIAISSDETSGTIITLEGKIPHNEG